MGIGKGVIVGPGKGTGVGVDAGSHEVTSKRPRTQPSANPSRFISFSLSDCTGLRNPQDEDKSRRCERISPEVEHTHCNIRRSSPLAEAQALASNYGETVALDCMRTSATTR